MKKLFLSLALGSGMLFAQNLPDATRAEYFMCKLNEGKTMSDMAQWSQNWKKTVEASDVGFNYAAFLLTSRYRTPLNEFDFIWVGNTPTSGDLGRANDFWLGDEAAKLRNSLPAVCLQGFNAVQWIGESNFSPSELADQYPITYAYCNLKDDHSIEDAYKAAAAVTTKQQELNKTSFRIIRPQNGAPASLTEYDFVISFVSPSWAEWGATIDNFWDNFSETKEVQTRRDTFSCENSRMYSGTVIAIINNS
ncbi:MAG: hypothetical protein VW146_06235 [Gammaproteobacteria bacterium]